MEGLAYTFDEYGQLLERFQDAGLTFRTFDETQAGMSSGILLRHDVDWSPSQATRMAKVETDYGATSTYFFLVRSTFYNPLDPELLNEIRTIANLGHRVGLHFTPDTYFDQRPSDDALRKSVELDREVLEARLPGLEDTFAFHSPPEWALGENFEGLSHTYEPKFFDDISYRSDSVGRWRDNSPFPDHIPDAAQVLTHPALWGEQDEAPIDRVRAVQAEMIAKTDRSMAGSRLDLGQANLVR